MDSHVVTLMGRLGNQLFQFGFATWLAANTTQRCRYDLSQTRSVGLCGPRPLRTHFHQGRVRGSRHWPAVDGRVDVAARLMRSALGPRRIVVDMRAQAERVDASRPTWWVGYWQNEEYAAEVRELLRGWFHVEDERTGEEVIRIHVRRGDYVSSRQALDPSWYARAATAARSAFPNLAVEIYSDDVPWCRENLGSVADAFIEGGTPEDDLSALSQAALLVASPSTFSWWAGFLGGMPVVSPTTTKSPLWDSLPGMRVR